MKKMCLFPLLLCCMAMKPGPHAFSYNFQEKHAATTSATKKKPGKSAPAAAAKKKPPVVKTTVPEELQAFNEAGFAITRWQYGDLDADGNKRDALLLLTDTRETENNYRDLTLKPRTVKLLIRSANGKLKEMITNNHCLPAKDNGGASGIDPFGKFIIRQGSFTLAEQSSFGSLHLEVFTTFRYDGTGNWNLDKRTEIGYRHLKQIGKKVKTARQLGKTDFAHYQVA
ncbi:MAG TPA: hypothetical protein VGC22_09685 [Chitinophaga sp.]